MLHICLQLWVPLFVGFFSGQNNGVAPSDGDIWCFVKVMSKLHYYMVDTSVIMKGTAVAKLQFILMSEEPFEVHGLKVMFLS